MSSIKPRHDVKRRMQATAGMSTAYPTRPLGEVLSLEYGKPLPEVDRVVEHAIPAYGANGILCWSRKAYRTEPSIIVGRKGSAGEITLTDGPFWPTDVTYFVQHNPLQTDLGYLFYLLQSLNLPSLARGVKPGINRNDVYTIPVPVPKLSEQVRLRAILDEISDGIARLITSAERSQANAWGLVNAVLTDVFTCGGNGWLSCNLGKLVTIKHGFAFESAYFRDTGAYTLLTPGNFFERGGYRCRDAKQKYYEGPLPRGFILSAGDLLVAMTEQAAGLLGSPMLVPAEGTFLHNQRLGLVEPRPGVPWVAELFHHLFNTSSFRARVHADGSGLKVRHTSPDKLSAVPVRVPGTVDEQRRVADRLSSIREAARSVERIQETKVELLTKLRRSILRQAFSGQLTTAPAIAA